MLIDAHTAAGHEPHERSSTELAAALAGLKCDAFARIEKGCLFLFAYLYEGYAERQTLTEPLPPEDSLVSGGLAMVSHGLLFNCQQQLSLLMMLHTELGIYYQHRPTIVLSLS